VRRGDGALCGSGSGTAVGESGEHRLRRPRRVAGDQSREPYRVAGSQPPVRDLDVFVDDKAGKLFKEFEY